MPFSMDSEHKGRVAVITGGCGAIGVGIARRLQAEGAIVHVLDINHATVSALGAAARPAHFHLVDVAVESEVERTFSQIQLLAGRIDYLICCAAVFKPSPFLELTPEQWQKTLQVNLTGSFLCCRAVLRSMRSQNFGRIVLFSSMIARTGAVNGADYASSKGGILGLARSLALEVAGHNVRVNTISPGITDTPQPRAFLSEADIRRRSSLIPLGRIGRVEDMVEACMFLLSEDSAFFVGQDVRVNGGASLW